MTDNQRFWEKVNVTGPDDCWEWTAGLTNHGYGLFVVGGRKHKKNMPAHRYSAMLAFGMFDQRLWVLHHCDNRKCVNPTHLYLGGPLQNNRDTADRKRSKKAAATSCSKGHPYDEENTRYERNTNGRMRRRCRQCERERDRTGYWQTRRLSLLGGDDGTR